MSDQTFPLLKNKTGRVPQAGILQDRLIILSGTTVSTIAEQKLSMKRPSREESTAPDGSELRRNVSQRVSLQSQAGNRGAAACEITSTGPLNELACRRNLLVIQLHYHSQSNK